jgi:spoIIIJ-associated protein
LDDAKQVLQEILDKMQFLAIVEAKMEGERVLLNIKGEDLGRIIGKEGASLHAFEILVSSIMSRIYDEPVKIDIDAADYRAKRKAAVERLANDVVEEVLSTGKPKEMRQLDARDRRIVHMHLKDNQSVKTESTGQGRDRKLIISPQ